MAETAMSALLAQTPDAGGVLVEIAAVRGSVPRETDAFMLVTPDQIAGTIGGGQLEFHAIDVARIILREGGAARQIDMALGPHLGQCCGGHVTLALTPLDAVARVRIAARMRAAQSLRREVIVFGLGHTGRALGACLALLPFRVSLVDDRADVFGGLPGECIARHLADPAQAIAEAAAGAAFVIMTHSHALDYRLADAALRRGDAAYIGMIGSATKRARFEAHFLKSGGTRDMLARFTCPVGGSAVADKRPEVIAALTAAELIGVLAQRVVQGT